MTNLIPYSLILKPGDELRYRSYLIQDEPGIPNDTYQLQEWYCPNPDCSCQEVLLEVVSINTGALIARYRLSLIPIFSPDPVLEYSEDTVSYARALQEQIADGIKNDPPYFQRLRNHYNEVKTAASDPKHPAYGEIMRWGSSNDPFQPFSSGKRKRHR
jgi:hypothetical protein